MKRVLFPLALLCVMAIAAGVAHGSMDYATGPGTVQYALAQPDGARVSLTMVVIGGANAAGVAVHEWWDRTNSIAALFSPPASLKAGQTIDLEGWMTTLSGGRRAVQCERIAFYLDTYGSPLDAVPPIKGLLEPSVWPSKGWIPVSPAQSGMSSMSGGGIATVLDDLGPPTTGDPLPGVILFAPPGSIAGAKCLANGTALAEPLTDKIVTAATGQVGTNCIYIEEPDRSAGIRVNTSSTFAVGEAVCVSGTLATVDGERAIQATSVTSLGMATPIKPSGIINRDLGGGDFEYDPQTGAGQQGMYDARHEDLKARGLNNIGLLVRTRGKVTHAESGCIYIDDGSSADDGSGHIGVRVEALSGILLPPLNATAEITGISSCRDLNGHIVRVLRVRTQDDAPVAIRVKPTGNDANNGSTWALAKATVQGAIDAAAAGMEIWVVAGTYNEHITLKVDVRLYGGFVGSETHRDERNVSVNLTILDGGGSGRVVTCPYASTPGTIVDGFTIRNGNTGIHCSSSPTITNNIITGNTTTYGYGAGIYCYSSSSPAITNNTITGNATTYGKGAGIYCNYSSAMIADNTISGNSTESGEGAGIYCSSSSPTITGNTITGNTATSGKGAGIYCGSATISHNTISSNIANKGGGIYCYTSATLTNNIITSNSATYLGGGIFCTSIYASPLISGNTIAGNSAAYGGGGIYCEDYSGPTITQNVIYSNFTPYATGGGVQCVSSSDPTITHNTITNNTPIAIYCSSASSSLKIANNTIMENATGIGCDNSSPTIIGNTIARSALGVFCMSSSPALSNNIIAFNDAGISASQSSPVLKCNCVYGNASYNYSGVSDPTGTDGNISADPKFVHVAHGNIHIQPSSLCIDVGWSEAPSMPTVDLDGQPRIQNGFVDIGADESDGCGWYSVTLSKNPQIGSPGETVTVTANIKDWNGQTIEGATVCFTASGGTVTHINGNPPPPGGCGDTDLDGNVTAVVTRETAGLLTVDTQVNNPCGTGQVTKAVDVGFYDDSTPVEVFFCVDCTGSMGSSDGDHRATESIMKFLDDMRAEGVYFHRLGGLKLNGPYYDYYGSCNDAMDMEQFTSLDSFTSVDDFINDWISLRYEPAGGDAAELQLDALHLAVEDMNAHSIPGNPNRYIVLITDSYFHQNQCGSQVTESQLVGELTASGCRVYVSLWESSSQSTSLRDYWYDGLDINGAFDPVNRSASIEGIYPLTGLRARILGNQP